MAQILVAELSREAQTGGSHSTTTTYRAVDGILKISRWQPLGTTDHIVPWAVA